MTIDIQRECSRRMPQIALHCLNVIARLDRCDGVRVPQIVKPDVRHIKPLHYALKAIVPDFEDCLLVTCAKTNKCDAIVTRNKKDFLIFGMTLLSPEELLELFPDEE